MSLYRIKIDLYVIVFDYLYQKYCKYSFFQTKRLTLAKII
ncbi:hypothetical protein CCYN49044_340063 [Capnocytophaga cynodegmi]|uniref:Uncharacterized protein n=1 Tax=Capnocytophaga cynodegmi TaxID=28189 RepID=A0A0B7HS49_9FLAO|nr:hypothetical protein CCYN49044_340063 [Capnocytophaga cynodegmi]CEN42100.1 hypothetical protein CCYN74_90063 [Capnocytophaga cynodegmi]